MSIQKKSYGVETVDIKVKFHSEFSKPLEQAHDNEWCDLRLAEDVILEAGDMINLNLGISLEVPEGWEAIMAPRSSTFKNYGILQTNSIGVIDNKYKGNGDIWKMPAYALKDVTIPAGTRIAQFRIQPQQPNLNFIEVEDMDNMDRGGLGSTGKN